MIPEAGLAAKLKLTFKTGKVMLTHDLVQVKQRLVHEIHVAFHAVVVFVRASLVALHLIVGIEEEITGCVGTANLFFGRHLSASQGLKNTRERWFNSLNKDGCRTSLESNVGMWEREKGDRKELMLPRS